jgi:Protein of unknown function (DUF3558)
MLLIWAAVAATVLAAGCSSAQDDPATPPVGAGVGPTEHRQQSPSVESPRDVRTYGASPCDVFTAEQLKRFGFDLPRDRTNTLPSGYKTCAWIDSGHNGELSVTTYPDWDILERTYEKRAALPVFEPLQIGGLPAVAHKSGVEIPRCWVTVGLAQQQGLDVIFTDLREPYEDPCGAARAAAEVAVGNLPPLG